ncbi:hypothetical protein QFZ40_004142 [Arthrobacter pascens]|nr:hypothetical protein [Arthrobacter pascens]
MSERADFEASGPAGEAGNTSSAWPYDQPATGDWAPPAENQAAPSLWAVGREDVIRGAVFSLVIIPVAVIAWMILWDLGWMASIVSFMAAAGAARLYVLGSGGTISRRGVWVVLGVTVVTVLLSFWGGMLVDAARFLSGGSPLTMLADPQTWDLLTFNLFTNPELVDSYIGDFLLALLFSALGCFFTLRRLFAQTRQG